MPVPVGALTLAALSSAALAWAGAAATRAVPASGGGATLWSRRAAPSPGRPARSPRRLAPLPYRPSLACGPPSPARGWPSPRQGDLAALPAPPPGRAERGPAEDQPPQQGRARTRRRPPAADRSPPSPGSAWARERPEAARWGSSSAGSATGRPGIPAALCVRAARSRGRRVGLAGAGVLAARPGMRMPGARTPGARTSGLARCRARRVCAAGRSLTAPALLRARFPAPVSCLAHAAGEGSRPCPLPRQPPWLRARRRNRSKTEEHKTVCQSTQTGQLMTNKTCRY
jgi:hypothetical protein